MLDNGCLFRRAILRRLQALERGQLRVVDRSGTFHFGRPAQGELAATVKVNDRRFYRDLALRGSLGASEAYLKGYWEAENLTAVIQVIARNAAVLAGFEQGFSQVLRPFRLAWNRLRENSRAGSKRNIAAHYDLSNDFFALMLDPTMTYSSGVFPHAEATLQEASIEKYDRICRKLQLSPGDHVIEIGTGWGGFAEHAVTHYGCRVTTTTISENQHDYAAERFRRGGLTDRITLLKQDYRDLTGKFDKLVSIEMIEAVGEQYLPTYFAKCCELLKPNGMMALQAITIPDHRYDDYRSSVDFIQRYIFPGGFLPSMTAISECLKRRTDFRLFHYEDFGPHYAETLSRWRDAFWKNITQVMQLGFDEHFQRMWHYYLCYCEAGFRERQIGVAQLILNRPDCRSEPILK